jgi:hypothetical protein
LPLKLVSKDDAFVASIFDSDGFQFELMTGDPKLRSVCVQTTRYGKSCWVLPDPKNETKYALLLEEHGTPYGFKGLTSMEQIEIIFSCNIEADYGTPTAESIWRIYTTQVQQQARNGTLPKPILVKIYTDGRPGGRNVKQEIRKIKAELRNTIYGDHAMLFQIVQTGKEKTVNHWFTELDEDEEKDPYTGKPKDPNDGCGDIIDCVSDYEIELAEVLSKNHGATWFDVPYYRVKCRVGVVVKALDKSDETDVSSVFGSFAGKIGAKTSFGAMFASK